MSVWGLRRPDTSASERVGIALAGCALAGLVALSLMGGSGKGFDLRLPAWLGRSAAKGSLTPPLSPTREAEPVPWPGAAGPTPVWPTAWAIPPALPPPAAPRALPVARPCIAAATPPQPIANTPAAQLALPESFSLPSGALPPAPLGTAAATPRPAAPALPMLPFQEAHWQGLELIPMTALLARSLQIPADAQGVIVDEATMPADAAGFLAGDLVISVGQVPTPDLMTFIRATDRVRSRRRADVEILRKSKPMQIVLTGMMGRLGTANGETAQTIPPGSRPPHGDQGPCTNCHRIGTKGQLPVDQGDLLAKTAPPILAGQTPPHGNRGICSACHKIIAQPLP